MKIIPELYKQALSRLDAGAKPDDLNDDEYRVFMFTMAINSIVDLAKRFKTRPLDVADDVEGAIEDLQKAGHVKYTYGKPDDDDDLPLF